jgi:hypothetical protein
VKIGRNTGNGSGAIPVPSKGFWKSIEGITAGPFFFNHVVIRQTCNHQNRQCRGIAEGKPTMAIIRRPASKAGA